MTALQSSRSEFIIDFGAVKGFPPKNLPFQHDQLASLLTADLATANRFKIVASTADAELILEVSGSDFAYSQNEGPVGAGRNPGRIVYSEQDDYELVLIVLDAKSLRLVVNLKTPPVTKVKKNGPNPRTISVQDLEAALETAATHQ